MVAVVIACRERDGITEYRCQMFAQNWVPTLLEALVDACRAVEGGK